MRAARTWTPARMALLARRAPVRRAQCEALLVELNALPGAPVSTVHALYLRVRAEGYAAATPKHEVAQPARGSRIGEHSKPRAEAVAQPGRRKCMACKRWFDPATEFMFRCSDCRQLHAKQGAALG